MSFPEGKGLSTGSIKAPFPRPPASLVLNLFLILTLALLITIQMWTPAEAAFRGEGYTILQNGRPVLSTLTAQEAEDILEGVRSRYRLEDARVLEMDFSGQVIVKADSIVLQEAMNVEEGLAYVLEREKPLLSVISKQIFIQTREIAEGFAARREYDILLTLENDRVIAREISAKRLVLTAREPAGSKELSFTEEDAPRFELELLPPVPLNVTCAYGAARAETGYHLGVDLYNPGGTPIAAAAAGTVSQVSDGDSYGKLVILDHGGGVQTYYAHCRSVNVSPGQSLEAGDPIGTVGDTGRTTGTHLHLELRLNGVPLDPMEYLL